jgi:hypothetical protein
MDVNWVAMSESLKVSRMVAKTEQWMVELMALKKGAPLVGLTGHLRETRMVVMMVASMVG